MGIAWCNKKGETLPQFKYWQTVYDMEMLLLRFVRSIRVGDLETWICMRGHWMRLQIGLLFSITIIRPLASSSCA